MVNVLVPVGVLLLVLTVRFEVLTVGLGLKLALEREGSPDTLSETEPVKPPDGVIVTA